MKKILSVLTALTMLSGMAISVSAESCAQGDVDMDGVITGHDAAMVSRYLLENDYNFTEEQISLADMDGDGNVTQSDADAIANAKGMYALGNIVLDYNYADLNDASFLISIYVCDAVNKEYPFTLTDAQLNNADVNLDGVIDLDDVSILLTLYATRAAGMTIENEVNNIYYYSLDPESPAYIKPTAEFPPSLT